MKIFKNILKELILIRKEPQAMDREQQKEPRPIIEIWKDIPKIKSGKEARNIHKELKQYGDGLFFLDRYPYFPLWISIISLVVSAAAFIVRIMP